jgi:hypothetical protein
VNGKPIKHPFEVFFPYYMLLLGFASTHFVPWLELMKEANLPNSLLPLLNVRCKKDNLWKIPHNQAKIYDYRGTKL